MGEHNKPLLSIKTNQGRVFKAIASILASNFNKASLIMVEQGVFIQEAADENVIFECKLDRNKFLDFQIPEIKSEEENPNDFIVLGFFTDQFKAATEKIGASDSVELFLHPSNTEVCNIKIIKGTSSTLERSFSLTQTTIGAVVPPIYVDHIPTTTILASEYKINLSGITKKKSIIITVLAQTEGVSLKDENSKISAGGCTLGKWDPTKPTICTFHIPFARLSSFSEISSTGKDSTIRIYAFPNLPLRLASDAGKLGTINMYFKSLSANNSNIVGN